MLRNVTARLELDIAGRTNMVLSLDIAEAPLSCPSASASASRASR